MMAANFNQHLRIAFLFYYLLQSLLDFFFHRRSFCFTIEKIPPHFFILSIMYFKILSIIPYFLPRLLFSLPHYESKSRT